LSAVGSVLLAATQIRQEGAIMDSLTAERSLICCIVANPEKALKIASEEEITSNHFLDTCSGNLFKSAAMMWDNGKPITKQTLADEAGIDPKLIDDTANVNHPTIYTNVISDAHKERKAIEAEKTRAIRCGRGVNALI